MSPPASRTLHVDSATVVFSHPRTSASRSRPASPRASRPGASPRLGDGRLLAPAHLCLASRPASPPAGRARSSPPVDDHCPALSPGEPACQPGSSPRLRYGRLFAPMSSASRSRPASPRASRPGSSPRLGYGRLLAPAHLCLASRPASPPVQPGLQPRLPRGGTSLHSTNDETYKHHDDDTHYNKHTVLS